jgi:transposase
MNKQDGRTLDNAALEERRRIIIHMKENGSREKDIRAATGCCRQVIYNLWNNWTQCKVELREEKVIKVKPAGTKIGERRKLTPQQEKEIKSLIKDKYPDQLKLDFALWTREAVKELIQQQFGIMISIRAVGDYLKRWGFTPQKPIKRAYERNPKKVKEWLENTYPLIKERAKSEKADIYWGDESTIKPSDVRGRGYAPKGQTPVIQVTTKKENVSMISAITNQGKIQWKLYDGSITAERVLEFAKQLIKYLRTKIYLILDNASTHTSKVLVNWVEANKKKIEVFYIPPYSPDLNPDERVNSDVKYGVGSKHPKRTKEELKKTTDEHMQMLKKNPKRIKQYFHDDVIRYAG